jgi:hypothetical protein
MPGLWKVTVRAAQGQSQLDSVDFFFCIDG